MVFVMFQYFLLSLSYYTPSILHNHNHQGSLKKQMSQKSIITFSISFNQASSYILIVADACLKLFLESLSVLILSY